ncbi:MAG: hypothetical protein ACREP7_20615 [Lysobacter sp.]
MGKWIFVVVSMLVSANVVAATSPAKPPSGAKLTPSELTTWPRMRATDFGCMLEKRFGVHDKQFGCAADYDRIDWGDGCDSGGNYHAGPKLPSALPRRCLRR